MKKDRFLSHPLQMVISSNKSGHQSASDRFDEILMMSMRLCKVAIDPNFGGINEKYPY